MTTSILSPIALSEPVKAGRRRFWKQILPVTEITYDGKKIAFDPKFHLDLATAFKGKAYDQVPIVFAGEQNNHNMDPRNFAGDIIKTEYRGPAKGQGTWALIEADRDGARAIKRNPKLGVSARIVQGVEKADGRFFNRAINHVLLTMNPKVTGMSPWQAVDLSEVADTEVVDLTAEHYTEGKTMPKGTKSRGDRRQIDLSALSDEDFNSMLDLATRAGAVLDDDVEDELVDEDEIEDEEEVVVPPRRKKSRVKTTKVVERESEDNGDDGEEDDPEEDTDTDLSEFRREFRQHRADTAATNWKAKRGMYLASGVPPVLLDLAEPVLSQPEHMTLDLSDDEEFDVHEFATQMLDQVTHIIDMGGEIGNAYDLSADDDTKSEADAFLDAWEKQYG